MRSRSRCLIPGARIGALTAVLLAGCSRSAPPPTPAAAAAAPAATNRVDIPPTVRQNLGITFATVERRPVAQTLRVPGRFELLPEARREYRVPAAGRVEPLVEQFARVEIGTPLYRLDAPQWRALQESIAENESALLQTAAKLESMDPLRNAHRRHEESLATKVELWTERVRQLNTLREAGGGSARDLAEAQATLNSTQAELADVMEKDAELVSRERELAAELNATRTRLDLSFARAASMSGLTVPELLVETTENGRVSPRWRTMDSLIVRATAPGLVEAIGVTAGGLVEDAALVLATVEPDRVRFRGLALQADLSRLRDGLPSRVVPLEGVAPIQDTMDGSLRIGLHADARDRTIDLLVVPESPRPWARPGVSAYLEVEIEGGTEELAVPLSCVVRDGLRPVLFRRDPKNADSAIRIDADLGVSDGRWVAVLSGVREGDSVVLGGAYPLLLATSGSAARGGHFHSDGTFHAEEH